MEVNYNSAAALRALLETENLGMRKKFGQNFLINPAIRTQLVDALEAEAGTALWEIGPGLGAMTRILLDRGLLVRAFEIDPGFIRILQQLFEGEAGFTLVPGDVLKTFATQPEAPLLLGNLPYNIASVLVGDMTEKGRLFSRMVLMVQKELALRMAARPGSADYSAFSVLCASAYNVKTLMTVKAASFYPRPNVDSAGVRLDLRKDFCTPPTVFYPLVRALFASRRKMIKNNLNVFLSSGNTAQKVEDIALQVLAKNNLQGSERAENLDVGQFFALAKTIEDMQLLK